MVGWLVDLGVVVVVVVVVVVDDEDGAGRWVVEGGLAVGLGLELDLGAPVVVVVVVVVLTGGESLVVVPMIKRIVAAGRRGAGAAEAMAGKWTSLDGPGRGKLLRLENDCILI